MHPLMSLVVPLGAVGIHWFGQSSYALKDSAGSIVQVDPYFPRERSPQRFVHAQTPLDEATLRTDFVLLTHNHRDHTWPESLLRIAEAFSHSARRAGLKSVVCGV
jgi:L-ascorbate metabolism protein UlaG (beta-lactamase superfamily)